MTGWLLDTHVVSELRKKHPDSHVEAWSDAQAADSLFLSSVTLAEIRYGIEKQPDLKLRNELAVWLDHRLRPWFAGRILPVDEEVILEWRRMVARGREHSIPFSQPALFIAAIAQVHSLVVCTRNEADFRQTGVPVFNPWMK